MNDGFLDSNVVVHALLNDDHTNKCVEFLEQIQSGSTRAVLHPLIVHELTYVLQRIRRSWDRERIAQHLLLIIGWPGIVGETELLRRVVLRWEATPQLSYVDAYLIEAALAEDRPVYTINVRDFAPFGVVTPSPLPSKSASGE